MHHAPMSVGAADTPAASGGKGARKRAQRGHDDTWATRSRITADDLDSVLGAAVGERDTMAYTKPVPPSSRKAPAAVPSSMGYTWGGTSALGSTGFPRLDASMSAGSVGNRYEERHEQRREQRREQQRGGKQRQQQRRHRAVDVRSVDDGALGGSFDSEQYWSPSYGDESAYERVAPAARALPAVAAAAPAAAAAAQGAHQSLIDVRDMMPNRRARRAHDHDDRRSEHRQRRRHHHRHDGAASHATRYRTLAASLDDFATHGGGVDAIAATAAASADAARRKRAVVAVVVCVTALAALGAVGMYALVRHTGDGDAALGWQRIVAPLRTSWDKWVRDVRDVFAGRRRASPLAALDADGGGGGAPVRAPVASPIPVRAWHSAADGASPPLASDVHGDVIDRWQTHLDNWDAHDYHHYGDDDDDDTTPATTAPQSHYIDRRDAVADDAGDAYYDDAAPSYADPYAIGAQPYDDEGAYEHYEDDDDVAVAGAQAPVEVGTPLHSAAAAAAARHRAVTDDYSRDELRHTVDVAGGAGGGGEADGVAHIYAQREANATAAVAMRGGGGGGGGGGAGAVNVPQLGASARAVDEHRAAPPQPPQPALMRTAPEPSSAAASASTSMLDMIRQHQAAEAAARAAEDARQPPAQPPAPPSTATIGGGGGRVYTASAEQYERATDDEQRERVLEVQQKHAMRRDTSAAVAHIYDTKERQQSRNAAPLAPTDDDTTDYVNVHTQARLQSGNAVGTAM